MSIWADQQIKELREEVRLLKERVAHLEKPVISPTWVDDLKAAYQAKFGKPPHHLLKTEGLMKALGVTDRSL